MNSTSEDDLDMHRPLTIFCSGFYADEPAKPSIWIKSVAYLILLSIILLNLYSIYFIYTKRNVSPVHQRAPWIAMYHTVCYLSMILLPLLCDSLWKRLDWNGKTSSSEVPLTRIGFKVLNGFLRFCLSMILPFRFAVIWFQWKGWEYKSRGWLWAFAISVMTSQKKALALIILVCLALFVLLYGDGGGMYIYKSAFDWYDPKNQWRLKYLSISNLRCLESFLGLVALYFVR